MEHFYRRVDPQSTCWEKLQTLKACMHSACREIKKYHGSKHDTVERDIALASAFFKAVVNNDEKNISNLIAKNPNMQDYYHIRDNRTVLTPMFFNYWDANKVTGNGGQKFQTFLF